MCSLVAHYGAIREAPLTRTRGMFQVGETVEVTRFWATLEVIGLFKVVRVAPLKIRLDDGTEWRANDGYAWGSKSDPHFGRAGQKRIRLIK